jgi:DNA repair protein RadC
MDKIKEMPQFERPRERLLTLGADKLSDAQLLAIILRTGCGTKNALSLAMEIINRFGSLRSIDAATHKELREITGLGDAKIAQLKAAFEIGKRLVAEKACSGAVFQGSQSVYEYFAPRLKTLSQEKFYCLILDVKNRLIKEYEVSSGTLNESLIHPREAFKEAIRVAGAAVIFVHNHPSGDPEPSPKDLAITERLKQTGEIIGIKVLDHVIVGDGRYVSLANRGHL